MLQHGIEQIGVFDTFPRELIFLLFVGHQLCKRHTEFVDKLLKQKMLYPCEEVF